MVVSLLGVLKAGAAYLPLDPDYPAERLGWMIADAHVPVLLAQERLLPALPPTQARVLCLEAGWEGDGEPASPTGLSDQGLAYVLYTSGSTGRPKGVMIQHRGIVNRLLWMQEAYGLSADDRVLQKTPYSFDVSVWEFFWPLITGAHLVVARPGGHRDSAYLAELIRSERVTVTHFVPSMLQAFLEVPDLSGCASLRLVVASGEALSPGLRRRFRERLAARLENLYGPTEASVDVTAWDCAAEARGGIVPIGRPVANTRIHLLDRPLQPVPAGIPGELCIGGVQLARGYLNRPDLTAERFVPDPCGETPGDRLYRTGDLARHLPDGAVEYLGRLDFQVKVRGFRIELGEIESVLASHPGVREAVVVARGEDAEDRRLVAYVVPQAGAAPEVPELRAFLAARVPEHMVPPAWVVLDELPLTPSGKVDRRALPAPEAAGAAAGAFVAPRNPVEEMLAAIWAEVLGQERVGVQDNFFHLGGHSLLATRIVSRVRTVLGVELPVRALFERPTVAELSVAIEAELRAGSGTAAPPLVPVPRDRDLPLSFSQERVWFFTQLEPESPAYNMPTAVRLEGALDAAVLDASLGEILARHESLRTTFHLAGEQPVQRIAPPRPFRFPQVDLSGLPADRREAEAQRLAGGEGRRPFDLARGPLLRGTLLRLSREDHVLLFNMHHIVADGWSIGLMLRELAALYPACSARRPSPLPPLPVQYADFAVWQREWLRGDVLSSLLARSRERLEGAPLTLELPSDRPHLPMPSGRGGGRSAAVPASRLDAMVALSRREGVTLYMSLLAVFGTLLHRYTGREDLLVGTHVAGRNRSETENLIGFFINELVLRADLSGDPPFLRLLPRIRETALDAYAAEDLPFDRLVEELQPERDLARPPVFQVLFVLQNIEGASLDSLELPGLALRTFQPGASPTTLDLTIEAAETDSGLHLTSRYNADLFDPATIDRLLGHFAALLEAASMAPETRLARLPLLTEVERQQLVQEWNDSATAFPGNGATFAQLFTAMAAARPGEVAAICGTERLTYGELDERAERLARILSADGAGTDAVVALLADRSLEFLTAVLGAFKAGAAYLPLDPRQPRQGWTRLLADSGARLALAGRRHVPALAEALGDLPAAARPPLLVLEEVLAAADPGAALLAPPEPGDLAYVIYTSGSTGVPKGSMITHRGMLNHLWAKVSALGLCETDVVAQTASQCFDISVWQLLAALLTGGRVEIFPDEVAHHPASLFAEVERRHVTVLETVPSLLRLALEELGAQGDSRPPLAHLRWMIPTGEALPPELCRRWLQLYPAVPLLNAYGPTECSDDVTHHPIRPDGEPARVLVPIGRPVPNLRLYVLDRNLEPLPAGVPGELFVGGTGVGRGYLRDGERTAQSFLPDSWSGEAGARLYRTGDLARCRADGSLEFLGRIDDQVKIRGFRIEPAEVEAALARHPRVLEAVVLAREIGGAKALVAYVVCGEARPATAELREHLRQRLPEQMVPAFFVLLPELPLTPNGKVDRRALPDPEQEPSPADLAPPRTPIEEILAGIWAEVLGRGRVGIHESFFDLGGHSLLATRVISRLRSLFGVELPMRALFERPNVAELAAAVEEACRGGAGVPAPPLVRVPREGGLPLSFAQERLWFLDRLQPESAFYNLPLALELRGTLSVPLLAASFAGIVARHEALRTTFRLAGGSAGNRPVQVIAPALDLAPPQVDLDGLPEALRAAEARRLARAEAARPFDLARGPLVRATILRLEDEAHVGLFNQHHIVSDAWSMGVLVAELTTLYRALAAGERPSLPDLPVQYADYAVWQRAWLAEVLEDRLLWWRERLAGAPHVLDLPIDQPRAAVRSLRGAREGFVLPAGLSAALGELLPPAESHPLHDLRLPVRGPAVPADRRGRPPPRHTDRRPRPGRDGAAARAVRQYAGAPGRDGGRSGLRRSPRPDA